MKTLTRKQFNARSEPHIGVDPPRPTFKWKTIVKAVRLALAVGAIAPMVPLTAQATVLNCPPPVTMPITVDMPSTIAATNTCDIQANVTISSATGVLTNTGTLNNNSITRITKNATLNNSGILVNKDRIFNATDGTVINSVNATFTNNNYLSNAGTLTNQAMGVLTNGAKGKILNAKSAHLNNAGKLTNGNMLRNYGALVINPTGELDNDGTLLNADTGTLTNDGTLVNGINGNLKNVGKLIDNKILANFGTVSNTGTGTLTITKGGLLGGGTFTQTNGITTVDGSLNAQNIGISGGTLAGTGTLVSTNKITIAKNATLSPGDPPGDIGKLTVNAPLMFDGTLVVNIDSTMTFDQLDVYGEVTFSPNSHFTFLLNNDLDQKDGDTFQFFNANSFKNFDEINHKNLNLKAYGVRSGLSYKVTKVGDPSLLLILYNQSVNNVPEPGSLGLMGLGVGVTLIGSGLGWRRKRGGQARG